MKPVIGVFPSITSDGKLLLNENYANALTELGAIPIIIPAVQESNSDVLFNIMERCDGFLFTGGIDIDPSFYNAERQPECGESSLKRDKFELFAFSQTIKTQKPILGICRGCQLINVALGGTLCQDIKKAYPNALRHTSDSVENPTVHEIDIPENSPIFKLSEAPRVKINSFHHQCVDKLGKGLKTLATSTDGIPEGVYFDGERYIVGVQWHPERNYKTGSLDRNIFTSFVEACAKLG